VIVLGNVLSHRINLTFDMFQWCQLTKVDGRPIRNIKALVQAFTAPAADFVEIDFKANEWSRNYVSINIAEEAEARAVILDQHKVSSWCAPQLLG